MKWNKNNRGKKEVEEEKEESWPMRTQTVCIHHSGFDGTIFSMFIIQ